jgi:DNA modification methylase
MTASHDALEQHYVGIESRYLVASSGTYGPLVTANGNLRAPIHRWFRMKEAYSSRLLDSVVEDTGLADSRSLRVLDPFSGSGTTGVSAGDMVRRKKFDSARVHAVEVNPFLHMVSTIKTTAVTAGALNLRTAAGHVARNAISKRDGLAPVPKLSTFANENYFPSANLDVLLALKASVLAAIRSNPFDTRWPFIQVALAAAVEPSSNLRKDGRALRATPGTASTSPIDTFLDIVESLNDDLGAPNIDFSARVVLGDSRVASNSPSSDMDLALFSPPYPNNIDYTEVYKLEGWFLDLYDGPVDFAEQRRRSLRSHSSLKWGGDYAFKNSVHASEIDELVQPIVAAVPLDRYGRGRVEVIVGYVDDMFEAIKSVYLALRVGGRMVIVVGNSMHGKTGQDYVIASDLLLARLAEIAGFTIERIEVARYPSRRTARSAFLRESLVFARKE